MLISHVDFMTASQLLEYMNRSGVMCTVNIGSMCCLIAMKMRWTDTNNDSDTESTDNDLPPRADIPPSMDAL